MGEARIIEATVLNTTITRDILTIERGVLVHQVNCSGVMGAGLAKKIANKWPMVKDDYLAHCRLIAPADLPGITIRTEVAANLFVVSAFGQLNYGRAPGKCYTNYRALAIAFAAIQEANQQRELAPAPLPVHLPHGIGCGLAGGDWHVVSALIEQELPDAVICRWGDL